MEENVMRNVWRSLWPDVLMRGIVAVVFGLLAFFWPGITVAAFVLLFGAFALVDGVLLVLQSVTARSHEYHWWARLLQGLISIAAGVAVFVWPKLTILALVFIVAFYALLAGVMQILTAVELRKVVRGELLLLAGGILSLAIGVLLFLHPLSGALALAQVVGIFAIAYGIMLAVLALQLRSETRTTAATEA